jgi:hypothetical protein
MQTQKQKVMTRYRFHRLSAQLYDTVITTSPNITMSECERHILFSYLISEKRSGPLFKRYQDFMQEWHLTGYLAISGEADFLETITWQELFEDCIGDVKP